MQLGFWRVLVVDRFDFLQSADSRKDPCQSLPDRASSQLSSCEGQSETSKLCPAFIGTVSKARAWLPVVPGVHTKVPLKGINVV